MHHPCASIALLVAAVHASAPATSSATVVVAPRVHAVGVEKTTAAAFELVLTQEMVRHGTRVVVQPASTAPCADAECAAGRARDQSAVAAFVCTLARLGRRHVVTLQRVEPSGALVWTERRVAASVDELDPVAVELGARAAGVRVPRRSQAPADSAGAQVRTLWAGSGPRVGFVYPVRASFAGAERLLSLAYTWRYQTPSFLVESVPVLGLAWGGDLARDGGKARDWTLLDVYVTWTPMRGDLAPYAGVGLGMHALRLERDGRGDPFVGRRDQSATALGIAVGGGLVLFRSYDFQVGLDARYQRFLHGFEELGGGGAQAFVFTFGVHHP